MQALLAANQYISSAGIVTVYLLLIVFAVLAFLVVVLSVGHKASGALKTKFAARKAAKEKGNAEQLPAAPDVSALPAEEDEAVVAAITAAITVILESEAPHKRANFVVRKIERI